MTLTPLYFSPDTFWVDIALTGKCVWLCGLGAREGKEEGTRHTRATTWKVMNV
jgi:hypothetical protein